MQTGARVIHALIFLLIFITQKNYGMQATDDFYDVKQAITNVVPKALKLYNAFKFLNDIPQAEREPVKWENSWKRARNKLFNFLMQDETALHASLFFNVLPEILKSFTDEQLESFIGNWKNVLASMPSRTVQESLSPDTDVLSSSSNGEENVSSKDDEVIIYFKCKICDKCLLDEAERKQHMRDHRCEFCNKFFTNASNVQKHKANEVCQKNKKQRTK